MVWFNSRFEMVGDVRCCSADLSLEAKKCRCGITHASTNQWLFCTLMMRLSHHMMILFVVYGIFEMAKEAEVHDAGTRPREYMRLACLGRYIRFCRVNYQNQISISLVTFMSYEMAYELY